MEIWGHLSCRDLPRPLLLPHPHLAWIACLGLAAAYVLNLYILVPAPLKRLDREHPRQIKARLASVAASCFLSIELLLFLAKDAEIASLAWWLGAPGLVGLRNAVAVGILLTACLYLGPILVLILFSAVSSKNSVGVTGRLTPKEGSEVLPFATELAHHLLDRCHVLTHPWSFVRNVAIAPLAEEIVFRGCFFALLLCNGVPLSYSVLASPLLFGVAHFHHIYESLRLGQSLFQALVPVLAQLSYTSIFGAYAGFLLVRTGHIASAAAAHMLCNYMGLPSLGFSVPPGVLGQSTPMSALYRYSKVIWMAHALGILLFAILLFPMTRQASQNSFLWRAGAECSI